MSFKTKEDSLKIELKKMSKDALIDLYLQKNFDMSIEIAKRDAYILHKCQDLRICVKALELAVEFINENTSYYCGDKFFLVQARELLVNKKGD